MNSSEYEHGRLFTGEVDWSSQLPEFSARDRDVLRFMGYETTFLTGKYFTEMLSKESSQQIAEKYKTYDFDFANLRTMQSEVAILRSLFLEGSETLTNEAADARLQDYVHNLHVQKGLKDVRVRIGNLADYAAVFQWFAEQQLRVQSSESFIATSTLNSSALDSMPRGKRCLAIKFNSITHDTDDEQPYPQYSVTTMPLYNPYYGARIAPIIVPA